METRHLLPTQSSTTAQAGPVFFLRLALAGVFFSLSSALPSARLGFPMVSMAADGLRCCRIRALSGSAGELRIDQIFHQASGDFAIRDIQNPVSLPPFYEQHAQLSRVPLVIWMGHEAGNKHRDFPSKDLDYTPYMEKADPPTQPPAAGLLSADADRERDSIAEISGDLDFFFFQRETEHSEPLHTSEVSIVEARDKKKIRLDSFV